jgi:hypothetical protein
MIGERRLDPGLPVRLQPMPSTEAAAKVRAAAALEVSVRPLGPDGRPFAPALIARLSVPGPQAGSGAAQNSPVLPSGGAAARAGVPPAISAPASPVPLVDTGSTPVSSRPATMLAPPAAPGPAHAATGSRPAPQAILAHLSVTAHGQALEAVVLPRNALGRTLLRAAGLTLQVDPSLDLPAGARLHLSLPAGLSLPAAAPVRSDAAIQTGPLDAVRTLAAWLREPAQTAEPARTVALRLPKPDATLASRLLRLVQLIVSRADSADFGRAAAPEVGEGQPGAPRVTAALAELGRVAGEPQHGGWRVLLLPLGFEGAPLLRLHLREDSSDRDGSGTDDEVDRSGVARRAVFEVEFGALGRCQIDALCQARRFDLLVRTEQPLPPELRREIRELYGAARDAGGLVGTARFRAGQLLALPEPGGPAGITV